MRIRKAPRNDALAMRSPSALTAHEQLLWKDELISSSDNEIAGQLFVQHVMKPLLGSQYVDAGVCSALSENPLTEIAYYLFLGLMDLSMKCLLSLF